MTRLVDLLIGELDEAALAQLAERLEPYMRRPTPATEDG
jgi:hypothetical protein